VSTVGVADQLHHCLAQITSKETSGCLFQQYSHQPGFVVHYIHHASKPGCLKSHNWIHTIARVLHEVLLACKFHGMEKVNIPWRHTPLAAGLKGEVGADCMGPIPNQHCCVVSGEGLCSLCYNGGFCSQPRSARIPSKREWMQRY